MTREEREPTPEGYQRYVLTAAADHGDSLTIKYGDRAFGGIMLDQLPATLAESIRPGTEWIVRLHTTETGYQGQVAHMLILHPRDSGRAEISAQY